MMKTKWCCLATSFFLALQLHAQKNIENEIILQRTIDGKYQLLTSSTHRPVTYHIWDSISSFQDGYAMAYAKEGVTFVNQKGFPISSQRYQTARFFSAKRAAVKRKGHWGFIDVNGKEIIPTIYERVFDFEKDVTAAKVGNKWQLIHSSGKVIKVLNVDVLAPFYDGVASIQKDNQKGYVTVKGEVVLQINVLPLSQNEYSATKQMLSGTTPCPPNIDFEYGNFTNWQCYEGNVSNSGSVNNIAVSIAGPHNNRHTIVPKITPSVMDYFGQFPINPPDGSGHAIKLGNSQVGAEAERVRYVIRVPNSAADYSITFQYAVVLENPNKNSGGEHKDWEQPRFTAKMQDSATGDILPCASFTYVASLVPGFVLSKVPSTSSSPAPVRYKPWSSVYVNLSKYAGKTLFFELTTADCTLTGHFGYAYVDVVECGITAKAENSCTTPNTTELSAPPGFQTYSWHNKDFTSTVGSTQDVTISPGSPAGTQYWVVVKPFNNTDCDTCDCRDTIGVKVTATYPVADAGPDKLTCGSSPLQIGSSASSGNTYQWSPAIGLSNPKIANPTTSINTSTNYVVTVTNQFGCTQTDTMHVDVVAKPVALFTVNQSRQCVSNNSISFTNNSSFLLGNLTYLWKFGDGKTSSLQNPSHSYTLPGTYKVQLVVYGITGCVDSTSQQIVIDPVPVPTYSIKVTDQCILNNNFELINNTGSNGGPLAYQWSFGDGNTSTAISPSYSYSAAGTYNIKLVVTGVSGCSDSLVKSVTVYAKPIANFQITQPVQCLGGNKFVFANQSAVSRPVFTYWWDFGDGQTSSLSSPTHSYLAAGTYRVRLSVLGGNSCDDTISQIITVHPNPSAAFSINSLQQCLRGNSFALTNKSQGSALRYQWEFGDGATSTLTNPSHSYNAAGSDTILLTATDDNGCISRLGQQVTVYPNPDIVFNTGNNAILCRGSSKQLIAQGALNLAWSPAIDLTCTNCPDPIASPKTTITYKVSGVNGFGCPDDDTVRVLVVQPFKVNVTSDTICLSETTILKASGADNYQWSPSFGLSNSTVSNPTASPGKTTVYSVIGSDKYGCFSDTAFSVLTVGAWPTINLGPDMVSSTGSFIKLSSTTTNGPIVNWSWTPRDYLNCTHCPEPVAEVRKDITYNVAVTNNFGCTTKNSVTIKSTCDNGQVFIANAFTPDGDGINDVFMVQGKGIGVVKSLRIFSRWGELLFERYNSIPNNPAYGWNGRVKGVPGPSDVFVYMAEVICTNGTTFFFKGNVTILK